MAQIRSRIKVWLNVSSYLKYPDEKYMSPLEIKQKLLIDGLSILGFSQIDNIK